jgi:hypothetical protein
MDAEGRDVAEVVSEPARRASRSELAFEIHELEGVKDWNGQLHAKPKPFFSYCPRCGLDRVMMPKPTA